MKAMARKITPIGRFNYQKGFSDRGEWNPSLTYLDGYIGLGKVENITEKGRNIGREFIPTGNKLPYRLVRLRERDKEFLEINQLEVDYKIAVPKPPFNIAQDMECKLNTDNRIFKITRVDVSEKELTLYLLRTKEE